MILLHIAFAALLAQSASAVEGIVVQAGSGEPIAGARINLHPERSREPFLPEDRPPDDLRELHEYNTTSGRDGKFTLNNVAPGAYRLFATKQNGYVPAEYGQRSATSEGIPFEITAGRNMTGIQLAMSPTGSISGRIYDRDGEPVGKAQVSALRSIYQDGRRRLTIVQSVQTNDRGEYRIYWLAPGNYYVSAKPEIAEIPDDPRSPNSITSPTERVTAPTRFGSYEQASSAIVRKRTLRSGEAVEETYVPTYYPGVVESPSATAIPVGPGANVLGIDMSVAPSIVPARHIRGRVISPANAQQGERVGVAAVPATSEPLISLPVAQLDANGLFDISGATAGRYYIVATADTSQGITVVDVGGADLQNVTVVMTAAFRVSGKFTIEGRSRSGTEPRITDLRISPFVRDPNILGMTSSTLRFFSPPPEPDGSFIIDGVSPGDFRVTIRGIPPDAYVKAIRMGGSDVLDSGLHLTKTPENPLEVVIGLNAGQVTGAVVNARQEPVANRTVVLVPNVRLRHRGDLYKKVSTDTAGRFRLQGITPGDYQLFAWNEVEQGAWQDPEFLRVYENLGRAIQISEGSDENVQLTVIP